MVLVALMGIVLLLVGLFNNFVRFAGWKIKDVKKLCGTNFPSPAHLLLEPKVVAETNVVLPDTFDARTQWYVLLCCRCVCCCRLSCYLACWSLLTLYLGLVALVLFVTKDTAEAAG